MDDFLSLLDDSGIAKFFENSKVRRPWLGGRPGYNACHLYSVILFAFSKNMFSLREMEERCAYDLRYNYLSHGEKPSYGAFGEVFNEYVVPHADEIFAAVTKQIINRIGITFEDLFIDGTKIEANANKYKFVWKPTTFHIKLSIKIKNLLNTVGLDSDLSDLEVIPSHVVAEKVTQLKILVDSATDPKEKKKLEKADKELQQFLQKSLEYEEKKEICGNDRNSYYKTDHDATAMTLKRDYYAGLGSNMHAAYNVQIAVVNGIICTYYLSQSRNDINDFIPTMERFHSMMGCWPKNICADAGYGSLDNYRFIQKNQIGNYVKHQSWQGNISGRNPDRFQLLSDGTIQCLNGKTGFEVAWENRHPRYAESSLYRVDGCTDCPFSLYCKRYQKVKDEDFKYFEVRKELTLLKQEAEENLLEPKGIEIRVNRSCQVEGAFGIIKGNKAFDRFSRRGLEKVRAEFMMVCLGYNLQKYFRFRDGNLVLKYWIAPENLKPETRKKPSAKRLSKRASKVRSKSANEKAKDEYKYGTKKKGS